MLRTKYQGSRPKGFRQEDLFMFSGTNLLINNYKYEFKDSIHRLRNGQINIR